MTTLALDAGEIAAIRFDCGFTALCLCGSRPMTRLVQGVPEFSNLIPTPMLNVPFFALAALPQPKENCRFSLGERTPGRVEAAAAATPADIIRRSA